MTRSSRARPKLLLITSILCAMAMSPSRGANAQEITAIASGNASCFGLDQEGDYDVAMDSFIVTNNIVSNVCDRAGSSGSRSTLSIGSVRVLFNAVPYAEAESFASNTGGGVGQSIRANATAELTYTTNTRFVDGVNPPFVPVGMPLRLSANWWMRDFGTPNVTASVRLTIIDPDGAPFFSDTQTHGSGFETDQYVLFGAKDPFDPFTITIEAVCSAVAPDDGKSHCEAIIDPIVEFDQATFDAFYGASSYPLADYWEVSLSPNLVPEPGTSLLTAAGVLALASLARRRTGARAP